VSDADDRDVSPDPLLFPLSVALCPPRATPGERPVVRIREAPEDFEVEEVLGFLPSGSGEHLWLWVEKCELNTDEVAAHLAAISGVQRREVGFAGLKDRNAVTRQWFSVPAGRAAGDLTARLQDEAMPGMRLLESVRNERKLRRGANRGNRFTIRIAAVGDDPGSGSVQDRATQIRRMGVPNYFGPQRFGQRGGNVGKAEAMFAGRTRRTPRHLRGLFISAARSLLFNQVLAYRVLRGTWNCLQPGEVVMLDGRNAFFRAPDDDDTELAALDERLRRFDVHPSGPLWGKGEPLTEGDVAALEAEVMAASPLLCQGLEQAGLKQERRSLRLPVQALDLRDDPRGGWIARFELPKGTFATAVLSELFELDITLV
jgi:tRNA pseudouridine13 synthase